MNTSLIKELDVKPTSLVRFGFDKSKITDLQTTFVKYTNVKDLVYIKTTFTKSEKTNTIRKNTTIVISDILKNRLTEGMMMIVPMEIAIDKSIVQSVIGLYCNPIDEVIVNPNNKRTKYKALKFKKNRLTFPRASSKTNYGLLNEHFKLENDDIDSIIPTSGILEHLFSIESLTELTKDSKTEGYDYFKLFENVVKQPELFDKMETMKIETIQL
jgi:hypothetical protein